MSWWILKYTQKGGFEEIEVPWEGDSLVDAIKGAGFGPAEEGEGNDPIEGGLQGIDHHYNEKTDHRITVVNGSNRFEVILTENGADHMALRVALAPMALVQLAYGTIEGCAEYGGLNEWKQHMTRRRKQEK